MTVNVLVPDTPCDFAVMVATPSELQVATPPLLIVATRLLEELHFAEAVRSCMLPSLYIPVALNVWFVPTTTEVAAGVTWIDWRVTLLPPPEELLPPQPIDTASVATTIDSRSLFIALLTKTSDWADACAKLQDLQDEGMTSIREATTAFPKETE